MERPDPGSAELTEPEPDVVPAEEAVVAPAPLATVDLRMPEETAGSDHDRRHLEAPVTDQLTRSASDGVPFVDNTLPSIKEEERIAADRTEEELAGAASPAARRRRALLPALLGLVLLGLLSGIVWALLDARAAERREDARQAALQAARQQAVNMTTISHETADRDLDRIIAAATGTLKTQFESQQATFPAVLRREKSVSTGRVLAAGVRDQDGDTVDALVAVDATVRNSASGAEGVVKHYRMDMRLVRIDGRWLVSVVAFAGLPQ